jgi:hypothetical protein
MGFVTFVKGDVEMQEMIETNCTTDIKELATMLKQRKALIAKYACSGSDSLLLKTVESYQEEKAMLERCLNPEMFKAVMTLVHS